LNIIGSIGKYAIGRWRYLRRLAAVSAAVLVNSFLPRSWPRTVRDVLARQILFTGVEAVRFISFLALLIGISVVVQAQLWLTRAGQSALLGPILVMVIIRELGPLLVNFVVIGRSGTAVATELGNMKISGEIDLLDAQGIDPFIYLLLPRIIGMAVSVFCLTVIFIVISFLSGYFSGLFLGGSPGDPRIFITSVFSAIRPADITNLLLKTLIPGFLTGTICALEGMGVTAAVTEVPQATTRAVVRSVTTLFLISALVSLFTYV